MAASGPMADPGSAPVAAQASSSGPGHVAIIGCGFTGTSALLQLVDGCPVRRITLFEASGRFGPGLRYQPEACADFLLNNTTDTLCLLPHNRRAFMAWLRGQGESPDPKGHLPRQRYGAFLADAVQAACTLAAVKGITVQRIAAEVTALHEPAEGGVLLRWPGGCLQADAAILAIGRCRPRRDIAPPPAGSAALLVANHLDSTALDAVSLDAICHVLGGSLSAYDVVNWLFSPTTGCRFVRDAAGVLQFEPGANRRQVLLCSRSGRLKRQQSRQPMALQRRHFTLPALRDLAARDRLTLASLQGLVDDEARAHSVALDWAALQQPYAGCATAAAVQQRAAATLVQSIGLAVHGGNFLVDLAGDLQTLLWQAWAESLLPPAEQQRYRQQVESALLTAAAPCPVPTAERLLALLRTGRLQLRHGTGTPQWKPESDAWCLPWALGEGPASVLIDTRGALDRRVDSPAQPALVRSLCAQGLLQPHRVDGLPADGAAVDMASLRATGSRHVFVAGMWLWGPGFFTSSAYMMARAVQQILAGLYPASVSAPTSPRC